MRQLIASEPPRMQPERGGPLSPARFNAGEQSAIEIGELGEGFPKWRTLMDSA